jgi:isoquinoline 1-oxidoreductase beta subunit
MNGTPIKVTWTREDDIAHDFFHACSVQNIRVAFDKKSGWGKELPKGHGLGICAHKSFLTYVACVVHVAFDEAGKMNIPEAHYAIDCGQVVNRNSVMHQFQGGFVFPSAAQ